MHPLASRNPARRNPAPASRRPSPWTPRTTRARWMPRARPILPALLLMALLSSSGPRVGATSAFDAAIRSGSHRPAAPAAPGSPAGIAGAGYSDIQVVNLDPSLVATAVLDFYNQRGGAPIALSASRIPAGQAYNLHLPAAGNLGYGAYGMALSADRPVAALVYTRWDVSGGSAIYENALPSTEVVLPWLVKGYQGQTSLVSIQNTDASAFAQVELEIHDEEGALATASRFTIGPGASTSLDLGKNAEFAGIPDGFIGSASLRSEAPIAVQSFTDDERSDKGVSAYQGLPVSLAWEALVLPLVSTTTEHGRIVVANPGAEAVELGVVYRAALDGDAGDRCPARAEHGDAPLTIPALGQRMLDPADHLPADCRASATLSATGPLAAVAIFEDPQRSLASAYDAFRFDEAGTDVALPLFSRGLGAYGQTTEIQVMNVGNAEASVRLEVLDSSGSVVACPGCQVQLGADQAWHIDPDRIDGLDERDALFGSAHLRADQPLVAVVHVIARKGGLDTASYRGLAMCPETLEPTPPRCARRGYAPIALISRPDPRPTPSPIVSPATPTASATVYDPPRASATPTATATQTPAPPKLYLPQLRRGR